jgi:uncharacterized damage-inducible protein DinB
LSPFTAGTLPALPVRATSWWYVGQIPVGNAAVVALGDAVAFGDAEAADELAATADDAAALADTGADDEATAAADDAAAAETDADAVGAACLLDVQAASTRLPPTMAMSARRCPMLTSLPTSGPIVTQRFAQLSDVYGALDPYTSDSRRPDASKGPYMYQPVPLTGDEKTSLHVALQRHRDVVLWKIEGLDDDQLRRQMTPSGTSLLGLVKHLAAVEYSWFGTTFGRETEPLPFDEKDPEADLRITADETTADVVDFYKRAWRASDQAIEEIGLDDLGTAWWGDQVSMRWVLIHELEETARHAGHMDILRELIDGATGDHNRPD